MPMLPCRYCPQVPRSLHTHIKMHPTHRDVQSVALSLSKPSMYSSRSATRAIEWDEDQRLEAVLSSLFPSTVRVRHFEHIHGHVHPLDHLTLSNGFQLLLKGSPTPGTPLLRQERHYLETEARFLALLGQTANPCIPRLYHYNPRDGLLGSAYLIRQYVTGTSLAEIGGCITVEEREDIDRHLGFLVRTIAQNVAPGFGSLQQVALGARKHSWRETFLTLFEGVLRDAEDMFIHLPYAEIRHEVNRLSLALDEVTLPRLVVVGLGRPSHVLIHEKTKQLAGVVDFSSAFWGDVLMAQIFEKPSLAFLEGAGLPSTRTAGEKIRLLMYASYRLVSEIAVQFYRTRDENKEFDARRRLMATISHMMTLQAT